MEPDPVLPPDPAGAWEKCRDFYLRSVLQCTGSAADAPQETVCADLRRRAGKERSVKNALRWIVRTHSLRSPGAMFDPPVVTVLSELYALLTEKNGFPALPRHLHHLWRIFN